MAIAELGTKVISTGNKEIDKKLGGGIPLGSLVLAALALGIRRRNR